MTFRSARKSKYVIMQEKRFTVDWATGRVEREDPPGYGEWERERGTGGIAGGNREERGWRGKGGMRKRGGNGEKRVLFGRGGKRVVLEAGGETTQFGGML